MVEELLEKYFKEDPEEKWNYADARVSQKQMTNFNEEDGFYRCGSALRATIALKKTIKLLNRKEIITDERILCHGEIEDIIKELLPKKRRFKNLEVDNLYTVGDEVCVSLKNKGTTRKLVRTNKKNI